VKRFLILSLLLGGLAFSPCGLYAQAAPEKGGHELEIWTGGGHSVKGIVTDTSVWNLGAHYGWILTSSRGPGFLRGNFEYAVGAEPIFWIFQPQGTAYGAAIDPLALKWNFDARGRIVPYADLDGGVLFTSRQVPRGTSRVNFTPSAALGMHILGGRFNWSAEIRYQHISNAGIASLNPGINTLQVRIGVGMFTHARED
jgi:lipid A 3-O-deacylase